MHHILLIDDDVELGELLTEYLTSEGFFVEAVPTGEEGLRKALSGPYDLIILDVMLPGLNGFEVLKQLRTTTSIPVLMLTARGEEVDRIVGLELGADDYLPKPFHSRELVARIRAVLRRSRKALYLPPFPSPQRLVLGDLVMDLGTLEVFRQGKAVDLTAVEFKLLELLVRKAGQVISREELCTAVLGRPLAPYDRSIDVHVSKLRKKLGREREGVERIKSIRNAGYLYVLPSSPKGEAAS
jgi:two-component system response regulator CpxR